MHYLIQSSEPHYKMGISSPMLFLGELMLSDITWLTPKKGFKTIWLVRKKSKTKNNNMHAPSSLFSHQWWVVCLISLYRNSAGLSVFHEAPPTLCSRMGNGVQGIPSLSDSGVVVVMRGPHTALGKGNGVDVVFRKSRGADAAPSGPRLQASGSLLWWPEMAAPAVPELCPLCTPVLRSLSPYGTYSQFSALRYRSPLTSVESPVPVLNSLFLRCVWRCVSHSVVSDSATPWTVAHQAPLSMGFSRQEYWRRCHSLRQGIFLTQGSNPGLLHCRQILYCLSLIIPWKFYFPDLT